jgi:hypothetical protein
MKNRWDGREGSSIVLKLMLKYIRNESRLSALSSYPLARLPEKIKSGIFPISAGSTGQPKTLIYYF